MMKKILFIVIAFVVVGCNYATAEKDTPPAPQTVEIAIIKFEFTPQEVTINKGDTVVWVNNEKRQYHSVWFKELGEAEADYLFPGDKFSKTFTEAGEFPYICGPHPKMTGKIIVK